MIRSKPTFVYACLPTENVRCQKSVRCSTVPTVEFSSPNVNKFAVESNRINKISQKGFFIKKRLF